MKHLSKARGATLILGALLCASSARAQGVFDMGTLTNTLTIFRGAAQKQQSTGGMPDLSDFGGAIEKKSQALAEQPVPNAGIFKTSLSVPSVKPGEASRALMHGMRLKIEEMDKANPGVAKPEFVRAYADLEEQMPKILTGIEAGMTREKLAKRDMGVAAGAVFTTLYETATNKKLSDRADSVALRAMASVAEKAWAPKWKTLAPAAKERLYENLLMSAAFQSLMADQFAQAGKTEDETGMRESAAKMFETLVGVPPSQVEISDEGEISGLQKEADAPATDAPATDAPATDAPATDAPATDAPATGAPTPDDMKMSAT